MDDRPEVTIYAARACPYCRRAERVLTDKGIAYTRIAVWRFLPGGRKALAARFGPGHTTVPQIVIDGELVGGCDALVALERSGQLDELLAP